MNNSWLENVLPIIFLAVVFALWNLLDSFAVVNSLSIILIGLCLVAGFYAFYYRFILPKRRIKKIIAIQVEEKRLLSDEEARKVLPKSVVGDFFASIFTTLFVITLFRSFLYEPFQIPSGSMEPTLRVGDFILVNKFSYGIKDPISQATIIHTGEPKRGDIVVFKAPKQPNVDYIKRVIGVEGDKIEYNFLDRTLTVTTKEGKVINFSYTDPKPNLDFFYYDQFQLERTETGSVTHEVLNNPDPIDYSKYLFIQDNLPLGTWIVPKGQYFMMGDNRDNSEDSRFWGFVPEQNIVGKASVVWFSLDKKQGQWPTGIRFSRIFTVIK